MTTPSRSLLDSQVDEASFQGFVVSFAAMHRWLVYHPFDSRRSSAGWPDLAMARDGRLVFAELKTMKGKVTVAQQAWLDALGAVPGVEAHVWRPADAEAVMETLR